MQGNGRIPPRFPGTAATPLLQTGGVLEADVEAAGWQDGSGSGRPRGMRLGGQQVEYHPVGATGGLSNKNASMKAFNKDTDIGIFELGNAFRAGDFDVDDLFKSWSSCGTRGGDGNGVKTLTRTTDKDGVQTTVTTIRSLREDADHRPPEMDVGAEVEAGKSGRPPRRPSLGIQNQEGSVGLEPDHQLRRGGSGPERRKSIQSLKHKSMDEESCYENVLREELPGRKALVGIDNIEMKERVKIMIESDGEDEKKVEEGETQGGVRKNSRDSSVIDTHAYDLDEDKVVLSNSEEDIESDEVTNCPWFTQKKKRGEKRRKWRGGFGLKNKHYGGGAYDSKGKIGMTTSEVTVLGGEQKLPAVALMLLNFDRMLDKDIDLFVETLFRAVKLNRVDVVKILCKLAMRKEYALSSAIMREPESSATVLHVALLFDHEIIVDYLIGLGDRDLVMATYTKEEYRNQTALHVAVANANIRLVTRLLTCVSWADRKQLMNTVAYGSYFRSKHPDGQLCLTACAWAGHSDMLIMLAKQGANFALANLAGETVMHRIVIASIEHPHMMDYTAVVDKVLKAIGEWAKHCHYKSDFHEQRELEIKQKQLNTFLKLLNMKNNDGETPLSLSAQRGSDLFVHFINMERIFKIPQTKLGSISWVTYDVTEITSYAYDSYNKLSILHVLAHSNGKLSRHAASDGNSSNILDLEPVRSLVEMKWRVYRWIYIAWFLLHFFYMIFYTYFTFSLSSLPFQPLINNTTADHGGMVVPKIYGWYSVFLILPITYIILEAIDLLGICPYTICYMKKKSLIYKAMRRLSTEMVITGNGPYRLVCVCFAFLCISWFFLYLHRDEYQDMMLALTLLFGWVFVLFFTRACRVVSRFSIMFQKMFFRDLMYFLAVYAILIIGFSFSVSALCPQNRAAQGVPSVLYHMLNVVTDLAERETIESYVPRHMLFTKTLMLFYALIAVILLMNMLIAMMNTSYETVRITRCNLWKLQQLSVLLLIERRLCWCRSLCRYSEAHIWQKDWDNDTRAYMDVTMTNNLT